jgi:hypothetical protein
MPARAPCDLRQPLILPRRKQPPGHEGKPPLRLKPGDPFGHGRRQTVPVHIPPRAQMAQKTGLRASIMQAPQALRVGRSSSTAWRQPTSMARRRARSSHDPRASGRGTGPVTGPSAAWARGASPGATKP